MIIIKNDIEIEYMRQAGKVVGDTLAKLEEAVKTWNNYWRIG